MTTIVGEVGSWDRCHRVQKRYLIHRRTPLAITGCKLSHRYFITYNFSFFYATTLVFAPSHFVLCIFCTRCLHFMILNAFSPLILRDTVTALSLYPYEYWPMIFALLWRTEIRTDNDPLRWWMGIGSQWQFAAYNLKFKEMFKSFEL